MTHKQARRKLGSRSGRRSGIRAIKLRNGSMRKPTKARVAVSVRRLIKSAQLLQGLSL